MNWVEASAYVAAAIVSSAATLIAVWYRHKLGSSGCDLIEQETKQNTNVYTALQYTLEQAQADRVYILEFHNGEHFYAGRGQQKFSCTFEIVKEGISAEADKSQDYRVSNYHNYIQHLVDEEKFCYEDAHKIQDHLFSNLLKEKGVKSVYNVPLKTLNGKIVGIMGIDYVRHPQGNNLGKVSIVELLKKQAKIITGYLL